MPSTTTRIRTGYDTWVGDGKGRNPSDRRLRLRGSTQYGFLYLPLGPELRGATIQSAKLHIWGVGTGWGTPTLTVRRVAAKWDAPTMNWINKPGITGAAATRQQTNPVDPTEWIVDVTEMVQAFASGARWYGFRLTINSGSTERAFRALESVGKGPWLEVTWTEAPAAPVDLSPSGERAVSISRPTLSWSNENSPEKATISAFQVQIDPAANATSPAFDSGTVTSELAEYDLSQSDYLGLDAGASTQWRVRVIDESGLWSDWSDWAKFSRADKGTVTITTPLETVAEFTPPVAWTTSFAQIAWRIRVLDIEGNVLHDTGRKKGLEQSYTIPAKDGETGKRILRDESDYQIQVRAWDDVDRVATPGDPRFAEATVVVNYVDDPTPDKVTALVATQVGETPYIDLTWNRATTPDSWSVIDNGKTVDTLIPGADLLVSGTSYKYRYRDALPGLHEFKVKPTVNGVTAGSPTATITPVSTGMWILGPDDIDVLVGVDGYDYANYAMPDRATTFDLPGSRTPVRVMQSVTGLRGEVRGTLRTWGGRDVDGWANRLLQLKARQDEPVMLYIGEQAFRARIFDIVVQPAEALGPNMKVRPVSFSFFQVGELDWLD